MDISETRWCPHGKRFDDECAQCETPTRFTWRPENATPAHITIRVFANGASAGLLTMRNEEYDDFKRLLSPARVKP